MSSETKEKMTNEEPGSWESPVFNAKDIFCYWKCSKCKENQKLQTFDKRDERL